VSTDKCAYINWKGGEMRDLQEILLEVGLIKVKMACLEDDLKRLYNEALTEHSKELKTLIKGIQ
jgi:hypothetical protein